MFKIKVGLKSFQTHSIQKCKYQIGQIVYYLKQSSVPSQSKSLSSCSKEDSDKILLNQEINHTKKVLSEKRVTLLKGLIGITPLPTRVKKITTLRSPHIDKKSREQFEWKREKAQIDFHLTSVPQISLVLFILLHSRFPGVEVEIGVESKTYFA